MFTMLFMETLETIGETRELGGIGVSCLNGTDAMNRKTTVNS